MEMSRIDFAILGGTVGALASFAGVRLMNMRWRHRTRVEWVGGQMLLRQPTIRPWLGVGLFVLVLVMLPVAQVARGPSNPLTVPIIAILVAVGLIGGVVGWTIGRRTVIVGPQGIELHGVYGRRIPWSELDTVQAFSVPPHRKMLLFRKGHGLAIALDSTYYGWEEFLERVSEIAPGVGAKVDRAMAQLKAEG